MNGEAIISVSAATVALVQLIKWGGLPDKWGVFAVLILAAAGVALWGYSQGTFNRADTFTYFAGWVAVSTSAAGVFGFVRALGPSAATSLRTPPSGAGQSPTRKVSEE